MIDFEPELLERNEEWRLVLQAYQDLHEEQATADPEQGGWLPRVKSVMDVPSERLAVIHGKLIALGLLQFELAGRAEGVCYSVSELGRRALKRRSSSSVEIADDFADLAQSA